MDFMNFLNSMNNGELNMKGNKSKKKVRNENSEDDIVIKVSNSEEDADEDSEEGVEKKTKS